MGNLPVIKDNIQILKYFKKLILETQNQNHAEIPLSTIMSQGREDLSDEERGVPR